MRAARDARTSTTSAAACAWAWARARAASASTARPGSCTASTQLDAAQANGSLRDFLAGALEGRLADPVRRPAAPGAPRRLDLPGPPRRGAPAAVTSPGWAAPSYDVGRHRRRPRRADARPRGWPRTARRSCSSPRASARPISAPARSTCSATRRTAWSSPGEALAGLGGRAPRPPVRARRRRARRAERSTGSAPVRRRPARRRTATAATSARTSCCRPPSARGSRSALVPETMAAGDLRDDAPMLIVGFHALRDFHAALCAANLARGGVPARSVVIEVARRRPRRRPTALGLARRFDEPRLARRVRRVRSSARLDGAARVGFPAGARRRATPTACGATCRSSSAGRSSRSRRCRRRSPACGVFETLRARAARARRAARAGLGGGPRRARRRRASRRSARPPPAASVDYRARWFVLATGGVASGGIALDSHWRRARDRARPAAARRPGAGRAALRRRLLRRAAAGPRRRGGRRRPAPRRRRRRAPPGERARRRRHAARRRSPGARGRATASAWRAATARPSVALADGATEGRGMSRRRRVLERRCCATRSTTA